MSQVLFSIGGAIFLVLGAGHGLLTLLDLRSPRAFTPTDPCVRVAMQSSCLALTPRANLWLAWLGFNLSHSLGLILFGGGLLYLAMRHVGSLASSGYLQLASVLVATVYFVLSLRFWFWAPALSSGLGVLCLLAAAITAAA